MHWVWRETTERGAEGEHIYDTERAVITNRNTGYRWIFRRSDRRVEFQTPAMFEERVADQGIELNARPNVDEASVLGVPDPKWGERIVAAVVPSGQVSEDELITWAKEKAAYAAVPKEIRFMDALPRNDIGKVDKKRLVAEWVD